jgi:hypothetical protein
MYKITETELRNIKQSLEKLITCIELLNEDDIMYRTHVSSDSRVIEAKKQIKLLEENYNIK